MEALRNINRQVRSTLKLKIKNRKFPEELRTKDGGPANLQRPQFGAFRKGWREVSGFQQWRGTNRDPINLAEPGWHRRLLPDFLRADGMYSPLEILRLIFLLMIPILCILVMGSRNIEFMKKMTEFSGDFLSREVQTTMDEQEKSYRKLDDEGIEQPYGSDIILPGSTRERRLREKEAERELKAASSNAGGKEEAASEYFHIMKRLKDQQAKDKARRESYGKDASDLELMAREQGFGTAGVGIGAQIPA
eukprot:Hpha_TRINITY_DN30342_c0_g1::TRINITY_DN30342_c0_g1_i1::g.147042::m.147042